MLGSYEYFQISGMNNQLSLRNNVFYLIKIRLVPTWLLLLLQRQHLRSHFDRRLPCVQRAPNLTSGDLNLNLGFLTYCGLGQSPPLNSASLSLKWILPLTHLQRDRVVTRIKYSWKHTAEYRVVLKCPVASRGCPSLCSELGLVSAP